MYEHMIQVHPGSSIVHWMILDLKLTPKSMQEEPSLVLLDDSVRILMQQNR